LTSDIHQILEKYWGFNSFRPLQEDIIAEVLEGKDTLALLPTGGGKSICFQVPILAQAGVGIVVSPLIALMQDQVNNLKKKGIKAIALTAGLSHSEMDIALENAVNGYYKFIYLSPERIQHELVLERLKRMRINLIAVDEAHCISQWGYDFRPAYLQISKLRETLPDSNVLALTATATAKVVDDIQDKLSFREPNVFQKSFYRENLAYSILKTEQKWQKCLRALQKTEGTSIVYARNRKATAEIAGWLKEHGLSADYYHAGLSAEERSNKLDKWLKNELHIMVCTNAFGMGIDKPDVRLVLHLELTDSIEAYFQEAGRAGRDGKQAHALLLLAPNDIEKLQHRYLNTFPTLEEVRHVYQCLSNHLQLAVGGSAGRQFPFSVATFSKKYGLNPFNCLQSLKMLEKEGFIALSEASYQSSRVFLKVNRTNLYDFQLRNPKMDVFIKVLMRSYGGLDIEFTPINEELLALRLKSNPEQVQNTLKRLEKLNILSYKPKQNQATLTILRDQIEARYLRISDTFLADRKKELEERINAVVEFVSRDQQCRSQTLLAYFNEPDSLECGICDVCRKKARKGLDTLSHEEIDKQIISYCNNDQGITVQDLHEALIAIDPEVLKNRLQKLSDMKKIDLKGNRLFLV
jgi:ATP-dependent DNA helicase RecQ